MTTLFYLSLVSLLGGCETIEEASADENCLLESCAVDEQTPQVTSYSVLNEALQPCSSDPVTGFFRDSYCRTDTQDRGVHVVCATMTEAFLQYTKSSGNDLSSPAPQYGFVGLKKGDRWCLCAARWYEAYLAGVAPPVHLEATDQKALQIIPQPVLEEKRGR